MVESGSRTNKRYKLLGETAGNLKVKAIYALQLLCTSKYKISLYNVSVD